MCKYYQEPKVLNCKQRDFGLKSILLSIFKRFSFEKENVAMVKHRDIVNCNEHFEGIKISMGIIKEFPTSRNIEEWIKQTFKGKMVLYGFTDINSVHTKYLIIELEEHPETEYDIKQISAKFRRLIRLVD
jgi:hypothetical protein